MCSFSLHSRHRRLRVRSSPMHSTCTLYARSMHSHLPSYSPSVDLCCTSASNCHARCSGTAHLHTPQHDANKPGGGHEGRTVNRELLPITAALEREMYVVFECAEDLRQLTLSEGTTADAKPEDRVEGNDGQGGADDRVSRCMLADTVRRRQRRVDGDAMAAGPFRSRNARCSRVLVVFKVPEPCAQDSDLEPMRRRVALTAMIRACGLKHTQTYKVAAGRSALILPSQHHPSLSSRFFTGDRWIHDSRVWPHAYVHTHKHTMWRCLCPPGSGVRDSADQWVHSFRPVLDRLGVKQRGDKCPFSFLNLGFPTSPPGLRISPLAFRRGGHIRSMIPKTGADARFLLTPPALVASCLLLKKMAERRHGDANDLTSCRGFSRISCTVRKPASAHPAFA